MNELSQQLKQTFQKSNKKEPPKTKVLVIKMNRDFFMTVILVLLIVVSALQAFELNKLKSQVKVQPAQAATSDTNTNTSTGSSTPSSLQNLPSQVGGC